jgi:DNA topoisomerase-2
MSSQASKYEKMTQREHVLARPDTYIGDIEPTKEKMWIYDQEKIVKEEIIFTPAFLKIFDEVLVNARDASVNDKTCDTIKVEYNKEEGYISVWNNGDNGIPVEEHPKHKILVPSMIFGEMLTSSNYNDTEKRTTGGKNGLGSKVCSIFSNSFIVEIIDAKNKKKFVQKWSNNMSEVSKAKVSDSAIKKSHVKVTFYPDLKRFGLEALDDTHLKLFYRRCIDMAGTTDNKVKVYFNDTKIEVNNFKNYIDLYFKGKNTRQYV